MIRVEQGGEYTGETYIWCTVHHSGARYRPGPGIFEGESLAELTGFLAEHAGCDG